ncbi:hypothetical protein Rsub_00594 [Raphidocelis subcapitata]|uniref:Uncharacterized protein n=1 Tax=Raphidocelis subcapitata TaxID=307507 RepID=A0A2V0NN45_9CHLO|nr:hypothetical protein Rsub_00594 [Raphidocelis subcapitata]|eukprot:GBF87882.1 hypothetical protein Rsub_00594 [Raphidocelis subcapitata]
MSHSSNGGVFVGLATAAALVGAGVYAYKVYDPEGSRDTWTRCRTIAEQSTAAGLTKLHEALDAGRAALSSLTNSPAGSPASSIAGSPEPAAAPAERRVERVASFPLRHFEEDEDEAAAEAAGLRPTKVGKKVRVAALAPAVEAI